MDYLSDLEKEKIANFNQDEVLVEAVRKVLLASIYSNGTLRKDVKANPLTNAALSLVSMASQGQNISNDQIANDLRALFEGTQLLETGLRELSKIKKEEKVVESPYNEAV